MSKRSAKLKRRLARALSRIKQAAMMSKDGIAASSGAYLGREDGMVVRLDPFRYNWRETRNPEWLLLREISRTDIRICSQIKWRPNQPLSPLETLARQAG